jgi:phage shock protein PspC (stress-responsive transcriptional regulator)
MPLDAEGRRREHDAIPLHGSRKENTMSVSDELGKLHDLRQRGVLSDEEFARAKARLLDGEPAAQQFASASPTMQSINGLRRTRGDRMIGGVCGGIARATGIASWAVRLVFALMAICAGTGVLLYVLMWILVPEEQVWRVDANGSVRPG